MGEYGREWALVWSGGSATRHLTAGQARVGCVGLGNQSPRRARRQHGRDRQQTEASTGKQKRGGASPLWVGERLGAVAPKEGAGKWGQWEEAGGIAAVGVCRRHGGGGCE
ncbi:hypothetical protein GGTG_09658 [Gaeumannomyces tritici R3-111a-1]|uniref:Uncharacterized protein n=1 Tax=Gaeumannomyces tritici (strain R3-111a-1) TaxID=644352 RepID=J3P820_GAET3|nr:hypothetical protein GGTG_09658 [Gaeumannomyces tritici R3-111a-1]EJT72803.1 hypothetical protein GGTG_09658 [Gaeumannomyces tritici R3-111a-1]